MNHVLAALVVLDALTTWYGLRRGAMEVNFVLRWLMNRIGVVPALVLTHAAMIGIAYVSPNGWPLWLACAFFAIVVANNLRVLRKG